jgi:hypothetical protein
MPSDTSTYDDWHTLLGPGPRLEIESAWEDWLASHDITKLGPNDIRLEIGRGKGGRDFRRCWIRKSTIHKVHPSITLGEEA